MLADQRHLQCGDRQADQMLADQLHLQCGDRPADQLLADQRHLQCGDRPADQLLADQRHLRVADRETDELQADQLHEVFRRYFAEVFRRLLRLGSFPVRWRVANVIPIPKGPLNTYTVKGF